MHVIIPDTIYANEISSFRYSQHSWQLTDFLPNILLLFAYNSEDGLAPDTYFDHARMSLTKAKTP